MNAYRPVPAPLVPCYTVGMDDASGLGRPQQDDDQLRHTLTIHEVGEQLSAAGVPRSERQIKRYCESGFPRAKKIPGPPASNGSWHQWPCQNRDDFGMDLQQWQMQRMPDTEPVSRGRTDDCQLPEAHQHLQTRTHPVPSGRMRPAAREQVGCQRGGHVPRRETCISTRRTRSSQAIAQWGQLVAKDQQDNRSLHALWRKIFRTALPTR